MPDHIHMLEPELEDDSPEIPADSTIKKQKVMPMCGWRHSL